MLPVKKPSLRDKIRGTTITDPGEYSKLTQGQKDEVNKKTKKVKK